MARAFPLALLVASSLAAGAAAEPLTVAIDHSARLNVAGAAASVVVGNPQVADVTVIDSHTVFISGRGYGQTDVVVLDGYGRTLYAGDVLVSGPSGGRVSVYRGVERMDMACAPGCEVSIRSPAKGASTGSVGVANAAGGGSNTGGIVGAVGQMAGAAAGGAQSVANAVAPPKP